MLWTRMWRRVRRARCSLNRIDLCRLGVDNIQRRKIYTVKEANVPHSELEAECADQMGGLAQCTRTADSAMPDVRRALLPRI